MAHLGLVHLLEAKVLSLLFQLMELVLAGEAQNSD